MGRYKKSDVIQGQMTRVSGVLGKKLGYDKEHFNFRSSSLQTL